MPRGSACTVRSVGALISRTIDMSDSANSPEYDSADLRLPPDLVILRTRCLEQARDLARTAQMALDQTRVPHISYHLAVCALEEVGKAELFGMESIARMRDGEGHGWQSKAEEHEQKIFFALWTPYFGTTELSGEFLRQHRAIASEIHATRLRALYVDPDPAAPTPNSAVSPAEAEKFLRLVEARIALAETWRPRESFDAQTTADLRWFIKATEDPVTRRRVVSSKSMEKLAQLGTPMAWIRWLKEAEDSAKEEARRLLAEELARAVPGLEEQGRPK